MPEPEERVKLVSVKTQLYNPKLASFKDIEKNNNEGKLSDEHVRTSVSASLGRPGRIPCFQILKSEKGISWSTIALGHFFDCLIIREEKLVLYYNRKKLEKDEA